MTISEKLIHLRRRSGFSQEELADRLGVSRQAVSRWETGTALPDAGNLRALSKLYRVTADYLLNDDFGSDEDIPVIREARKDSRRLILFCLIVLEVLAVIVQFMTMVVLENLFFSVLSLLPFAALIVGFEYAYRKKPANRDQSVRSFRTTLYTVTAWLGLYFPVRFAVSTVYALRTQPTDSAVFECIVLAIYLTAAALVTLELNKRHDQSPG